MTTTEDKYNILIKDLNLKEYYDKGFLGQGVTIASIESTDSSHGSQVKNTLLTYAPKANVISYNDLHDISAVGDQNGNVEFPKFVDWCIENKVDIVTSSLDWVCNDEREKEAVITKAKGEVEASENLAKAAETMAKNPVAVHLRTLETINDLSSDQSNTVIFALPVDVLKSFDTYNKKNEK